MDFELRSEIASVTDLLRIQVEEKNLTLSSQLDAALPRRLIGDPVRLRQVLTNLVGNALKFTPPSGHIAIEAVALESDDTRIKIRFAVRDSGIGIAAEVQPFLFEPFTQGDGSTTRRFGGTGLGLSICKRLVELMGGSIGVESTLAQGSTFWFTLSFEPGAAPAGAAEVTVDPGGAPRNRARRRREKILLVEDNAVNRLLAERQFKQLGFDLTSVANGREAVEAVQTNRYDLVFMDCHMPEMDGFEATKRIRLHEATTTMHVPIVAMTADAQTEDRGVCLAAGMDDYLPKPSILASIQSVLARWLPGAA